MLDVDFVGVNFPAVDFSLAAEHLFDSTCKIVSRASAMILVTAVYVRAYTCYWCRQEYINSVLAPALYDGLRYLNPSYKGEPI